MHHNNARALQVHAAHLPSTNKLRNVGVRIPNFSMQMVWVIIQQLRSMFEKILKKKIRSQEKQHETINRLNLMGQQQVLLL